MSSRQKPPALIREFEALIDAAQYAVNRLDADKNQPQVAAELSLAVIRARIMISVCSIDNDTAERSINEALNTGDGSYRP